MGAPDKTTEQNYLDSDAHILGLGASLHLSDPLALFAHGVDLHVGLQAQILPDETILKDASDAVGNFAFGGTVLAGGAGLSFGF